MIPHKKCIDKSKKMCHCIADYVEESEQFKHNLPSEEEIRKIINSLTDNCQDSSGIAKAISKRIWRNK